MFSSLFEVGKVKKQLRIVQLIIKELGNDCPDQFLIQRDLLMYEFEHAIKKRCIDILIYLSLSVIVITLEVVY